MVCFSLVLLWVSELRRLANRSSSAAVFNTAKVQMLDNWYMHFMSGSCDLLRKFTYDSLRSSRKGRIDKSCLKLWFVLPYYKGFNYGLVRSAMSKVLEHWTVVLSRILGCEPVFRLAFKNAQGNLELAVLRSGFVKSR